MDYEAKDNENLAKAIHLVLDDRDATLAEHQSNEERVKTVAAAASAGVSATALGAILGGGVAVLGA